MKYTKHPKVSRKTSLREQSGFSMVEMMVALVILALGLLGVAGMETATAKYRVNVQSNAAAAQLFSDLSERIRANPEAAGPSYDPTSGTAVSKYILKKNWSDQTTDPTAASVDCAANTCSSDQRADYDMVQWRKLVKGLLPQGAAWIDGDRKVGFQVTLMWMDKEQTEEVTDANGRLMRQTKASNICQANTPDIVINCCPDAASVVNGVRCTRVSLLP